jgi:hypothetical protein
MEPFVGDDERVWILAGPLHLLFCTAPSVRAPVVASVPATTKIYVSKFFVINFC